MIFRYGDAPIRIYPDSVPAMERKKCVAQQKLDGWRCYIVRDKSGKMLKNDAKPVGKDNSLYFVSRRGMDKGGPKSFPVSQKVIEEVEALDLPDLTELDSEWVERRVKAPKELYIFDVLWLNNLWMGSKIYSERWDWIKSKITTSSQITIPEYVENDFISFFEKQKSISYSEGIVIKMLNGKVAGHTQKGEDSMCMFKVRYREVPGRGNPEQ